MAKKVGAPTKFLPEYCKSVERLCKLGAKDSEIAEFFEVQESTINNWKKEFPEFLESIKRGKQIADQTVADSLFKRANGFKHKEDVIMQYRGNPLIVPTVKKYPPDTTAAIFWLKNRRPDLWRDKTEVQQNGSTVIKIVRE